MRIYTKLLIIISCTPLLLGWLPTTAQVTNSYPVRENHLSKPLVQKIRSISGKVLGTELDALLAVSNVQEIIWRLGEEGAAEHANELETLLRQNLEHSAVRDMRVIRDGHTNPWLIELDDGLRAVFKTIDTYEDNFRRELLLYRFDHLIGTHVVPITITRTIDGKTGSMQLFIENSISAEDILQAKLRQLGLSEGYSHRLLLLSTLPQASPVVKTLRLLALERDENPGNYLLPLVGRQVAIDGGRTFLASTEQVKQNIANLHENPAAYYLNTQLVANIERNNDAIKEILSENSNLYQQVLNLAKFEAQEREEEFRSVGALSINHLYKTFRAYKNMVDNHTPATNTSKKAVEQLLVEALATKKWEDADEIIATYPHLFYHEITELLIIAKKQRDWQLIRWMLQHDKYLGSKELEFALAAGEYEFAARLSSLGVETCKAFQPLHDNLHLAIILVQDLDNLQIDWHKLDWDSIDWQEVQAYAAPIFHYSDDEHLAVQLAKYLDDAVAANDWQAADGMLRNGAEIISIENLLQTLSRVMLVDPNKIDWFINHATILQKLDTEEMQQYQQGTDIFSYLRMYIYDYVLTIGTDDAEILAREKILTFFSGLLVEHPLLLSLVDEFFVDLLQKARIALPPQQQRTKRLQYVIDTFQQQGLGADGVQYLQLKLQHLR